MFRLPRIFLHGESLLRPGLSHMSIRNGYGLTLRTFANERSQVRIKVVAPDPAQDALNQKGYEERNEQIGRVLSPHLTIYAPQLTSMLSISQRISGMALTIYVWSLGIGSLLASNDMQHYITMCECLKLNDTLLTTGKFFFVLPVTFHYLNALRHILWSFGSLLKLNLVYSTGYAVLALTPLSAIGLSFLQ